MSKMSNTVGIVCIEGFDKSKMSMVKMNHVTFRIFILEVFIDNLACSPSISRIVLIKSCFRALRKGPSGESQNFPWFIDLI